MIPWTRARAHALTCLYIQDALVHPIRPTSLQTHLATTTREAGDGADAWTWIRAPPRSCSRGLRLGRDRRRLVVQAAGGRWRRHDDDDDVFGGHVFRGHPGHPAEGGRDRPLLVSGPGAAASPIQTEAGRPAQLVRYSQESAECAMVAASCTAREYPCCAIATSPFCGRIQARVYIRTFMCSNISIVYRCKLVIVRCISNTL